MIQAIMFDMDGVLIDARDWHYEALNKALALFGFAISRFDHLSTYDGLPTRRKLEMLSVERGLPVELHGFINEMKQQYTMEIVHTCCKPRFAHEYALSKLAARGLRLGVASNSIRSTVDTMMAKARLAPYLQVTLSADDVVRPKPDPEIYQLAMRRLGVVPAQTLVVEDNEHGVRAARACGAHVLVVKNPSETNLDNIVAAIDHAERGLLASVPAVLEVAA